MIIPTKNYVTYTTLARMNIQTGHPVLLVGQRSCGKTVVMRKVISEMRKVCNMRVFSTAFSTRTNPLDFQHILETKLERRGRALLTGPNYKPAAIVIEDMHLPTVFDSPPHGFLYDYQSEYKMHEPYTRFDVSLSLTFLGLAHRARALTIRVHGPGSRLEGLHRQRASFLGWRGEVFICIHWQQVGDISL